jgi:nicotinamide-nucleotide adenylyltransferase
MKKVVLIIGRFQPLHLGHIDLIKKYSNLGYFVKIGIGSVTKPCDFKNPLSFRERANIIRKALKENKIKNYKMYGILDIPKNNHYASHVSKIVGEYDLVITGNMLVKNIFLKYCSSSGRCKVNYFDEKIKRIKGISAKDIRKNWIMDKTSGKELLKSTSKHLKKIKFSDRLKEIYNFNRIKVREI